MTDVEQRLALDREAPLPEPPDPEVTRAIVAQRLARRSTRQRHTDSLPRGEVLLFVGATLTLLSAATGVLVLGLSPWWLLVGPLLLLPLSSILYKGVS